MKKMLATSLVALGMWAGSAQAVTVVSFAPGGSTLPAGTTVFQDFEGFASGSSIGSNAFVTSTSPIGNAVRPAFGSSGNYALVAGGGSYTVSFQEASIFSFVLGSLDSYNTLTLRYSDGSTSQYSGLAITNDQTGFDFGSGNRTAADNNGVVSYRVTSGPFLTGATFTSSDSSFEFDNLAIAPVPEPAAWGMMILGFGLVGGAIRRRSATKVSFAG